MTIIYVMLICIPFLTSGLVDDDDDNQQDELGLAFLINPEQYDMCLDGTEIIDREIPLNISDWRTAPNPRSSDTEPISVDPADVLADCINAVEDYDVQCISVRPDDDDADIILVKVNGEREDVHAAEYEIKTEGMNSVAYSMHLPYGECVDDDDWLRSTFAFYGYSLNFDPTCETLSQSLCEAELIAGSIKDNCCSFRELCAPYDPLTCTQFNVNLWIFETGVCLDNTSYDSQMLWGSTLIIVGFAIIYFLRTFFGNGENTKADEVFNEIEQSGEAWLLENEWHRDSSWTMLGWVHKHLELFAYLSVLFTNVSYIYRNFQDRPLENVWSETNFMIMCIYWFEALCASMYVTYIIALIIRIAISMCWQFTTDEDDTEKDDNRQRGKYVLYIIDSLKELSQFSVLSLAQIRAKIELSILDREASIKRRQEEGTDCCMMATIWDYVMTAVSYFLWFFVCCGVFFMLLVKLRSMSGVFLKSIFHWTWWDLFLWVGLCNQFAGLVKPKEFLVRGILQATANIKLAGSSNLWVDIAAMVVTVVMEKCGGMNFLWGILCADELFCDPVAMQEFLHTTKKTTKRIPTKIEMVYGGADCSPDANE